MDARKRAQRSRGGLAAAGLGASLLATALCACASTPRAADPMRYRLGGSGTHWDVSGADPVLEDVLPLYPDFFRVVLDPSRSDDPDTLALRDDLEATPVTRSNYDALNAVAIGYFELNFRGEQARERDDAGLEFLSSGFRAAKLLGVPWRAYGEIQDPALRDAILDFFDDAGSGTKLGTARTVGRLVEIVRSLRRKETDPVRGARIEAMVARLRARADEQERSRASPGPARP